MDFLLIVPLLFFICFDVHYFVFTLLAAAYGFVWGKLSPIKLTDESVFYGLCFTNDMDFQWHMNNARYLRSCDFARFTHFSMSLMYQTAKKLGARVLLAGSNIRYRRSLEFLDIYRIHTKVLCWDEKAFYMEQRFERRRDNFVNAIVIVKIAVTGSSTPQHIVDQLQPGLTSPQPLPEVSRWIDSVAFSSERLRKAS